MAAESDKNWFVFQCKSVIVIDLNDDGCVSQEGLLSSLTNLQSVTLSRNSFSSYPGGGPSQFCSVCVSFSLFTC